jgi:methylenetetrahydrofolate dehydrogenase (NADP+)/methenyltetrahydrofolate cyclohydrolase
VVVLGEGRLVGSPSTTYAKERKAKVVVLNQETFNEDLLNDADIVVSGIGKPHFITASMLKPGVVVFDAGTSEDGGELAGDVHPDVSEIASYITPVPGGIGPITIACLLQNLIILSRRS